MTMEPKLTDTSGFSVDPSNETNRTTELYTTAINLASEAKKLSLYKGTLEFNRYYSPFIVIIGLIGNTLSLLVMMQVSYKCLCILIFFLIPKY